MTQHARRNPRRGKRGKLQKQSFPLFPPGLDPDYVGTHIPTAPATGFILNEGRKKR
jgi:hypothetical protein